MKIENDSAHELAKMLQAGSKFDFIIIIFLMIYTYICREFLSPVCYFFFINGSHKYGIYAAQNLWLFPFGSCQVLHTPPQTHTAKQLTDF